MDKPLLLGLHGVRGVGKDTTVQFVTDWAAESDPALSVVRRGFADKMKWAYMRQWVPDCTMEWAINFVDQYKNDRTAVVAGGWTKGGKEGAAIDNLFIDPVIFRDHMDWFATESAREIYGDDFWISQLLPPNVGSAQRHHDWHDSFQTTQGAKEQPGVAYGIGQFPTAVANICCVADVRVPNEVERIREFGGILVKVKRRDIEEKVHAEYAAAGREVHLFAQSLADDLFDVIIVNDDNDMDNSRRRTVIMMDYIYNKRAYNRPLVIR